MSGSVIKKSFKVNELDGFKDLEDLYTIEVEVNTTHVVVHSSFQIFSTAKGFKQKMRGSNQGGVTRFNLMAKEPRWPKTRSVKKSDLISSLNKKIKEGMLFQSEPVSKPVDDLRITKGVARHTANFTPSKGWVIGSFVFGPDSLKPVLSFSENPKIHSTEAEANNEIVRLATLHKDKIFVKLKIENFVQSAGVTWS